MLALPIVKTRRGIPHRDIFNMPTLDATSSKHNNKQTEPQQLELCNTTHKSHNDKKYKNTTKKLQKTKIQQKNIYLFITQRLENGYTPLTCSSPPPPPTPKKIFLTF